MSSTYLTPTAVTNESLRILHQKLKFVGTINKQYDSSFAKSGAKIGDSLKIRLPNQYTVTTGATMVAQDVTEDSVTLQVATQKHVGMRFDMDDLTLSIDRFSERYIDPAMSVLAASIEADVFSVYKSVPNLVDSDAAAIDLRDILDARMKMVDNLTPDGNRYIQMATKHAPPLVDALKALFHESTAIKKQYREGMMGRTGGFDFYENTHVTDHTTGTAAKGDTSYNVNGATEDGDTITVDTGTATFLIGDVITIAGCNAVHPETKVDLGYAKQFVITANSGGSATSLSISPAIVVSGAKQNVSGYPTNGGAITKVGAGNGEKLTSTLAYYRDAFTFATADLLMPKGVDFSARQVLDGISMRIVRNYDINNDRMPCRIDVLYGYKAIRPQLACRIHADG